MTEIDKNKKPFTLYRVDVTSELLLPLFNKGAKAGFPSPALDYFEESIDLNKELIKHPASTYLARADGDSLVDANVADGDLLILDKFQNIVDNDLYVCYLDGGYTVKYIQRDKTDKKIVWLTPANKNYPPIKVTEFNDFRVWAKVMYIIKKPPRLNSL